MSNPPSPSEPNEDESILNMVTELTNWFSTAAGDDEEFFHKCEALVHVICSHLSKWAFERQLVASWLLRWVSRQSSMTPKIIHSGEYAKVAPLLRQIALCAAEPRVKDDKDTMIEGAVTLLLLLHGKRPDDFHKWCLGALLLMQDLIWCGPSSKVWSTRSSSPNTVSIACFEEFYQRYLEEIDEPSMEADVSLWKKPIVLEMRSPECCRLEQLWLYGVLQRVIPKTVQFAPGSLGNAWPVLCAQLAVEDTPLRIASLRTMTILASSHGVPDDRVPLLCRTLENMLIEYVLQCVVLRKECRPTKKVEKEVANCLTAIWDNATGASVAGAWLWVEYMLPRVLALSSTTELKVAMLKGLTNMVQYHPAAASGTFELIASHLGDATLQDTMVSLLRAACEHTLPVWWKQTPMEESFSLPSFVLSHVVKEVLSLQPEDASSQRILELYTRLSVCCQVLSPSCSYLPVETTVRVVETCVRWASFTLSLAKTWPLNNYGSAIYLPSLQVALLHGECLQAMKKVSGWSWDVFQLVVLPWRHMIPDSAFDTDMPTSKKRSWKESATPDSRASEATMSQGKESIHTMVEWGSALATYGSLPRVDLFRLVMERGFQASDIRVVAESAHSLPAFLQAIEFVDWSRYVRLLLKSLERRMDKEDEASLLVLVEALGKAWCATEGKECMCCSFFSLQVSPLPNKEWTKYGGALMPLYQMAMSTDQSSNVRCASVDTLARLVCHVDPLIIQSSVPWQRLLRLVMDPSRAVRNSMERVIVALVVHDVNVWSDETGEDSVERMLTFLLNQLASSDLDARIRETLLSSVGRVGLYAKDEAVVAVLRTLMYECAADMASTRIVVQDRITSLAGEGGIRRLLSRYQKHILPPILGRLVQEPELVREVAQLLYGVSLVTLIRDALPVVLPGIVLKEYEDGEKLLETIVEYLNRDTESTKITAADVLDRNMHHILAGLLAQQYSDDVYFGGLRFLFRILGRNPQPAKLFYDCLNSLIGLVVLDLGDADPIVRQHTPKKIRGLMAMASHGDEHAQKEDMSTFLRRHFMGAMEHLFGAGGLSAAMRSIEQGIVPVMQEDTIRRLRQALAALEAVIKLLGPTHLESVSPKIKATLLDVMNFAPLRSRACDVWLVFLKEMDDETLVLIVADVVVELAMHVEAESTDAVVIGKIQKILEYIFLDVAKVKKNLRDRLRLLWFLPNSPHLRWIHDLIAKWLGKQSVFDMLEVLSNHILHESPAIRQMALQKLRDVLETFSDPLEAMIQRDEHADPLICQLFARLVRACRHKNEDLCVMAAQCLGALGAVDPGRMVDPVLMATHSSEQEDMRFHPHLTPEDLAIELIRLFFVRLLKVNESSEEHDLAAYAIQEALKFCGITLSTLQSGDSQVEERWKRIPVTDRKLVEICLSTKWQQVQRGGPAHVQEAECIFEQCTDSGERGFKRWISRWIELLVSQLRGHCAQLYHFCTPIVRVSANLGAYLLPYVIKDVLNAGQYVQGVGREMDAVVQRAMREQEHMSTKTRLCLHTVLSLVDVLQAMETSVCPGAKTLLVMDDKFGEMILAQCAFHAGRMPLALRHVEMCILNKPHGKMYRPISYNDLQPEMVMLQRIYASMDEADALSGLAAVRPGETPLEEDIVEHECAGRWTLAQTCYEQLVQRQDGVELKHHTGLLRCLRHLGHLETMLGHIQGLMGTDPDEDTSQTLNTYAMQVAWRLGKWQLAHDLSNRPMEDGLETSIATALLALQRDQLDMFKQVLLHAQLREGRHVGVAGMDSYEAAYTHVRNLHMLADLESIARIPAHNVSGLNALMPRLRERLNWTGSSFHIREPILNLQRAVQCLRFGAAQGPPNLTIARTWLSIAKYARKAEHHQTAYSAFLHAKERGLSTAVLERSKQLWNQGHFHKAVVFLERSLQQDVAKGPSGYENEGQAIFHASCRLKLGEWMASTGERARNDIEGCYRNALSDVERGSGQQINDVRMDAHYNWGRFLDKNLSGGQPAEILPVIQHYFACLNCGHRYLYRSMARMISLWLDDEDLREVTVSSKKQHRAQEAWTPLNECVEAQVLQLPVYMWLTCMDQLSSRILHEDVVACNIIQRILVRVVLAYPQQALWGLAGFIGLPSSQTKRKRILDVFKAAAVDRASGAKEVSTRLNPCSVEQFNNEVVHQLKKLCNAEVGMKGKTKHRRIPDILTNLRVPRGMELMVPLESSLQPKFTAKGSHPDSFEDVFNDDLPCIAEFSKEAKVMGSMRAPKKFHILGTDGHTYVFLAKPTDDMRKDKRFLGLCRIINRLLLRNPQARDRRLRIRTYAVIPLSEQSGLVQWVQGLESFRGLTYTKWDAKKLEFKSSKGHNWIRTTYERRKATCLRAIMDKFPPQLWEWLLENFPNPTEWYRGRLRMIRSLAVMSMVGYVVGLGDRHGENISLNAKTAEAQHVDFDALFFHGLRFSIPERVPFRLTFGMQQAFGPTRAEGPFRHTCEITLGVLRENCDTVLALLEPFVYDPQKFISSVRDKSKNSKLISTSVVKSKEVLIKIRARLEGRVAPNEIAIMIKEVKSGRKIAKKSPMPIALSVSGHVEQLLKLATDEENLSNMYFGWGSYL